MNNQSKEPRRSRNGKSSPSSLDKPLGNPIYHLVATIFTQLRLLTSAAKLEVLFMWTRPTRNAPPALGNSIKKLLTDTYLYAPRKQKRTQ